MSLIDAPVEWKKLEFGVDDKTKQAIAQAAEDTNMPEGVFSLLQGRSNEIGGALVADPRIAAVGFTGSRGGGTALMLDGRQIEEILLTAVQTMMGVLAVVILLALSWWVTHALYVSGKTEDCLMSGRSNCAEVR